MVDTDLLYTEIVEQIEAYITGDNLENDYVLASYARENDGWIRLELLSRYKKLSRYNYDRILHALYSKRSNIIELSSFEPRCIRHRCQSLTSDSIQDNRTVIVTGLPYDIKCEELIEFFNRFYPIEQIKMFSSSKRFNGTIHVIFDKSQDALAFIQQSKSTPIIYANNYLLQSCNGYTLICKLINDDIDKELIKQNDQHSFIKGKSFSTRLSNHSPRVSFNTNTSSTKDNPVRHKSSSILSQTKTCLKSNTSATEQILFCQNITTNKSKNLDYTKQKIVYNKFSYDFYIPDHLLKHTHECIIISVLNPYCYTIQLTQDALEFDKFQREINDFYNTIDDKQWYITPEQIRINLCVICSDSKVSNDNKIWNRTQILDFDSSDNTVNLFYADLGTWEEYVPINRLRHITDRFHQHQVFSIPCRLAHILPINNENDQVTWTDEATNQFIAVIDQVIPEVEFLSFGSNGCLHTNLFVINSDQPVCVNDYMIHIKQAKSVLNTTNIDDDEQTSIQSDEHGITGKGPPCHPVVALYNRLGEILQRSVIDSRTTSTSSSEMSSPSTSARSYVKVLYVNIETNTFNRGEYNNQQKQPQILPIIFVRYQKTILIPDFNICTLLKIVNSNINIHTIENYTFAIRYPCVHITRESNFDIFTQLSSLNDIQDSNSIALYNLDFVGYILEHYNFRVTNVLLALENAKYTQLHPSDLVLWFAMDNEMNNIFSTSSTPVSNDSTKINQVNDQRVPISSINQPSSISIRLPFSNRLINPM